MTAEEIIRISELLPTSLGSEELRRTVAADILRQSIFSARMESARYLMQVRETCAAMVSGAIDRATAVAQLTDHLAQMGHSPLDGGGLTNPAARRRLNLILETRTEMAAAAARVNGQTAGTVYAYPAWELTRFEKRDEPRKWWDRWQAAGEAVAWEGVVRDFGRMIALKSSPIWAALGRGAGGYRDTLGNPFPPFAFGSGMDWLGVDRETCVRLGLIGENEHPPMPAPAMMAPGGKARLEALQRTGFDLARGL